MFNVVVGIVWQVSLVALPVYIVIREFDRAAITAAIVVATSVILKFTWYGHLQKRELKVSIPAEAGAASQS
jgi:heme/copper-type cytochrome/quinol oxidase subunit 4